MKDKDKLGIGYAINKNLREFHFVKCRKCKKTYQQNTKIKKCSQCGYVFDKEKSSVKYLRKRLEELEIKTSEFYKYVYYFIVFMIVVRDDVLKEQSMKKVFKRYFDETIAEYLTDLKLDGTAYYVMVHSETERQL